MKPIAKQILSSNAVSITFNSIPGIYTDLILFISARSTGSYDSTPWVTGAIGFNGSSSGYTGRTLFGTGTAAGSDTNPSALLFPDPDSTANTFGNAIVYIPNYTGSENKIVHTHCSTESNTLAAASWNHIMLWSNTSAITSILIDTVGNLQAGSTFYLYGITKA